MGKAQQAWSKWGYGQEEIEKETDEEAGVI